MLYSPDVRAVLCVIIIWVAFGCVSGAAAETAPATAETAGGDTPSAVVTPWFGNGVPVQRRLRELFGTAEYDVAVAADRFTDYSLAEALITVAARGRRVRVVVGGDRANVLVGKAMGDYLKAGGVEVAYARAPAAPLLDRFVVIDERIVMAGSYPFTEDGAASPLTDVVVIDDITVAKQYLTFFDYIWNLAK